MQTLKLSIALVTVFTLAWVAPASGDGAAPPATASPQQLAEQARSVFWTTLHDGDYAGIGHALELGKAAARALPGDPEARAHLGWLHIWRVAERARTSTAGPDLAEDIGAARASFEQAVALRPDEARYLGFYATTLRVEGDARGDDALSAKGDALMQEAVQRWPEFNLFTAGYPMGTAPVDSPEYHQGIDDLWRDMEVCAERKLTRGDVDFTPMMALHQVSGPKRACWNSWIAPHNFEGFFLALGDMLVKEGDWQTARRIYANARLSADYTAWPYRDVLERRIVEAAANVEAFRNPSDAAGAPRMMIASEFACMACHQAR